MTGSGSGSGFRPIPLYGLSPARYAGLSYPGSKNQLGGIGTCQWIAERLPPERRVCYIEPYAGMLGVMLYRPRSYIEIANDLNGRLVNWWRVVRNQPAELRRLVECTPWSETELAHCQSTLDEGCALERARKYHAVLKMSMFQTETGSGMQYSNVKDHAHMRRRVERELELLAERIREVVWMNKPAVDVLRIAADWSNAVIYCDPPYASADTSLYGVVRHDRDATLDALRQQRGRVAISGYGDEWDALGWERQERIAIAPSTRRLAAGIPSPRRVEVLWTNYTPSARRLPGL